MRALDLLRVLVVAASVSFTGCANVSTTRFSYKTLNGSMMTIEVPKELEAEELLIEVDADRGRATLAAKSWKSKNVETIKAQGDRESVIVEKAAEGAARGAMKGLVPSP